MGSRTYGSTVATMLPTLDGGHRSVWSSDWVVAAILVLLIAVGVDFHH
jgi:hypothetical protein